MTTFTFCGSCKITEHSLVCGNNPIELDNRPQTSREISSSIKFPTKETQREIALGLLAGKLACAAWQTARLPFVILPRVLPG